MKFLCDQMLGTLAKWLRIYGFDTFYANSEIDDDELLRISKKENRILITRDKNLAIRAKRKNIKTLEITSTDIDKQIKTTLEDKKVNIAKILSRCIICNTIVNQIKKENVKGKVPKRIFDSTNKFWFCPKCNKIYWKGSHYDNMIEKIKNLG